MSAPTWREVLAELDRRTEARKQAQEPPPVPVSVVDALKAELERHRVASEETALNDAALLALAAGTDQPHSTRESVAALLRQHWDKQQDNQ